MHDAAPDSAFAEVPAGHSSSQLVWPSDPWKKPLLQREQVVAPEVPAGGSEAKEPDPHVPQVSGSTRYSPPPHCAQSLRTEPPPLLVNMSVVETPERSRFQQIVLSNEVAYSNMRSMSVTEETPQLEMSPLNEVA